MRLYLPLTPQDRPAIQDARANVDLEEGRAAWAVTSEASADRPGEDEEDLEYEALQDAVHVAFTGARSTERVLVIAADVPDGAVLPATEDGGAFGIRLRELRSARIASFHVTEQTAEAADADDTDPALLWFDAGEGSEALEFLDAAAGA
ncbi:hypothetical protein CFK41_06400 [Brachybacterium ginsengisoli]|uniref:Uncharacterized protein n=1 Tax=Brachybacterium ginsengisoli TaxID=1331682 RepID=A0A291GW59_9MICO|nr:hypothetical protein [Brachybacterium ginsengisoli]ATG54439.1 hypothetical protein CFK41_06400 [Brachybacterium ginsengisoli]